MTAHPLAITSHRFGAAPARTPRDVEYSAFSHATRKLRAAQRGDSPAAAGVHDNTILWSALASDLAEPDNALPEGLRAALLSLALFSIRHGREVAAGRASVDALIDINLSIMKALRGEVAA